uniref:LD19066p n=1 Tax=Drosophila melanogaster TaxID=7227 RepID=Q95RN5_DROME|nr:LD19066p [Drosophila melanogaster]
MPRDRAISNRLRMEPHRRCHRINTSRHRAHHKDHTVDRHHHRRMDHRRRVARILATLTISHLRPVAMHSIRRRRAIRAIGPPAHRCRRQEHHRVHHQPAHTDIIANSRPNEEGTAYYRRCHLAVSTTSNSRLRFAG